MGKGMPAGKGRHACFDHRDGNFVIGANLPQSRHADAISAGTHRSTGSRSRRGTRMSVRITAAGAVAIVCLSFLTAPVSACDERYIKKCEKVAAAAAAAEEGSAPASAARRK